MRVPTLEGRHDTRIPTAGGLTVGDDLHARPLRPFCSIGRRTSRCFPSRSKTGATDLWDGTWNRSRRGATNPKESTHYGPARRSGGMDQAPAPGRLNEVETVGVITPISGRRPRDRSTTEGRPSTGGILCDWRRFAAHMTSGGGAAVSETDVAETRLRDARRHAGHRRRCSRTRPPRERRPRCRRKTRQSSTPRPTPSPSVTT